MRANTAQASGYRRGSAKGGSKKGRKLISWMRPPFVYYKIAAQRLLELTSPDAVITRDFGGIEAMRPLLAHAQRHDPEVYAALLTSRGPEYPERTEAEMLGVLYDRGHKKFYNNTKDKVPGGRASYSSESYSNSPKLIGYLKETEEKFGIILGVTTHRNRKERVR